jgi:hypothetical protein
VLRLVENRVLSFGQRAPRLLLIPAPGTAPETLTALRGRMTEILGASGITVVAGEAVALPGERAVARRPGEDRIAPARAAVEAGAHFVAVTSVSAARAPTPVGGVVLDATIQYTLMRVYDAAIVGERVFTARGSGVSAEMALQRVLAEVAPMAARGLAGKVAESLFSNGRVVDMSLQPGTITVNVMSRPNPAATIALLDFLRERGFRAALGPGRQAPLDRVAVERIVIHGRASVEELYTLFAVVSFGSVNPLRASVFEHGADSLGIEILDQAAVPVRQAVALGKTEPVRSPSDPPPTTVAMPLATPAVQPRQQAPQSVRQAQLKPQRAPTPLEFEFSEAFEAAMVAGKISVK